MTRLQALVAALVSYGLTVAAVAGLSGPFWAMLTAGVVLATATVLLYDPAVKKPQRDPDSKRIQDGKRRLNRRRSQ